LNRYLNLGKLLVIRKFWYTNRLC